MDRNMDMNMNGFGYDSNFDPNMMDGPMFNPMMQYEQAYMYYRYMTQQVEYKIKCKEYDKLCNSTARGENSRSDRRE